MSDAGKLTKDDIRNQQIATLGSYFAPIKGAVPITPSNSVLVKAGKKFAVFCTVAGNVKVTFSDGSTFTFPVAVGYSLFDWSITQVWVTGTTATAVYTNLN